MKPQTSDLNTYTYILFYQLYIDYSLPEKIIGFLIFRIQYC